MKEFIEAKLRQGQFSTPSEYIRSLIRDDQDLNGNREMAILVRRGMMPGTALTDTPTAGEIVSNDKDGRRLAPERKPE